MCELGFQHMTGTDTAIVAAEEKWEEGWGGWEWK
jgi:hypothetical protein